MTQPPSTCAASPYPYFCEFILQWLEEQAALGKTVEARHDLLYRGGLTIHTTLDPDVQRIVDRSLREVAPEHNSLGVAAGRLRHRARHGGVCRPGPGHPVRPDSAPGVTAINYAVDRAWWWLGRLPVRLDGQCSRS